MRAYERLMRYAQVDTQSDENGAKVPSTEKQYAFAWLLRNEMNDLGVQRVMTDKHAYTYGFVPASDFTGTGVKPQLHKNYDGGDVALGTSGRVLRPADFPDLKDAVGQTLITTDGTTLLGADDKAGVAEIITLLEKLLHEEHSHAAVAVCFPPDEEIGHGAALLDLKRFGAAYAYTVDGDEVCEINFETFNAAAASFEIRGVSVHPGSAKDIMVNAALLAV